MLKKTDCGFSLIELIIIIAIIAVLVSVLAPQYLKYVERSRMVRDEEFADEIRKGCEMILNDDEEKIEVGMYVVTITPNTDVTITGRQGADPTHLDSYLKEVLGQDYARKRLVSRNYSKIQVTFSNTVRPSCDITYVNSGEDAGNN